MINELPRQTPLFPGEWGPAPEQTPPWDLSLAFPNQKPCCWRMETPGGRPEIHPVELCLSA